MDEKTWAVKQQAEKTIEEIKKHGKEPLLIVAGPGTRKSTTLAGRVARLIKNGVDPKSIYLLSFTNASVKDLNDKLKAETKDADKVSLFTVHRLANQILRSNSSSKYFVSNEEDDLLMLKDCYPSLSYSERKDLLEEYNKKFATETTARVDKKFAYYIKDFYKALNFYEITRRATKLLKDGQVLNNYSKKFEYLIVDEYQDLNPSDQSIIELLSSNSRVGLTICGDDDQSIYGFRYANPKKLIELYSSGRFTVKKLEFCFRSPKSIVEAAHSIISLLGSDRIQKNLYAEDSKNVVEIVPLPSATENKNKEAEWVATTIKKLIRHPKVENILVLARELGIMSELKQILEQQNLPLKSKREKVLAHDEAKKIYYSIRLIENKTDNLAVRWIIELLEKNIDLSSTVSYAIKHHFSLVEALDKNNDSLKDDTERVIRELLTVDKEKDTEEILKLVRNLHQILPTDPSYLKFLELSKKAKNLQEIINKVESEFLDIEDYESDETSEAKKFIDIMTMHSSKGLTRDVVFIMGVEDEFIPKSGSLESDDVRLFYVALSRASKKLVITFVKSRRGRLARGKYKRKRSKFIDRILNSVDKKYYVERKV